MTMQLVPSQKPRERILAFGVQGTGKSHAIAMMAKRCPNNQFWVLDNDQAWPRLLTHPDLAGLNAEDGGNVHIFDVDNSDFEQHVDVVKQISAQSEPDDWCVLDMWTPTWDAVQSWFSDQVFDQSIEDYFVEVRKMKSTSKQGGEDKTLAAFEGFMDWPVINKVYTGKWVNPILRLRCHLYATAEQAKVEEGGKGRQGDDKDIKNMFGPYGVKPKGQKRTGHLFQTVLLMTKNRVGEYRFTTIKDRARTEVEEQKFGDFSIDYFMKIAGWKPGVTNG